MTVFIVWRKKIFANFDLYIFFDLLIVTPNTSCSSDSEAPKNSTPSKDYKEKFESLLAQCQDVSIVCQELTDDDIIAAATEKKVKQKKEVKLLFF